MSGQLQHYKSNHSIAAMKNRSRYFLLFMLGHCVLKREHLDIRDDNGSPISIMHSRAVTTSLYEQFYNHYIQELFKR